MNTAAATTTNQSPSDVGFALPINTARTVAGEIVSGTGGSGVVLGQTAFLGVIIGTPSGGGVFGGFGFSGPTGPSSQVAGVTVGEVISGTPAADAGLQAGDVIVAFDGHRTTTDTVLKSLIVAHRPGEVATVTYVPAGSSAKRTVKVHLAAGPVA